MAGVEPAIPGNGACHTMLSVALHSVGRFISLQMPLLAGPRHCGQLSARTAPVHTQPTRHTAKALRQPATFITAKALEVNHDHRARTSRELDCPAHCSTKSQRSLR